MGVSTQWDNEEKTVIRYVYEGRWTWDEYYPAHQEAREMTKSVEHIVHVIVDVRNSTLLPKGALTHSRSALDNKPANEGITVIVGANFFIQVMANAARRIDPEPCKRYRFGSTIEEAHALLAKQEEQTTTSSG